MLQARTLCCAAGFDIEKRRKKGYTYGMAQQRNNKSARSSPVDAAAEFGIDIEALKDNLKRSPAERIRRHKIALNSIEKLRRAKRV